jgi:hypothetical protein
MEKRKEGEELNRIELVEGKMSSKEAFPGTKEKTVPVFRMERPTTQEVLPFSTIETN